MNSINEMFIDYTVKNSNTKNKEIMRSSLINYFSRLKRVEEDMGKSVLEMDKDEIIQLLSKFLSGSLVYKEWTLSMLTKYLSWAIERELTKLSMNSLDTIKLIQIDISNSIINIMVKDEADLIECLDDVLNPLESDSADNFFRCYILLLFAGLPKEEVLLIKNQDIDLQNKRINYKGQIYNISNETYKVMSYISKMTSIAKTNSTVVYNVELPKGDYFIKNIRDNTSMEQRKKMNVTYGVKTSTVFSQYPRQLNLNTIMMSGIFYRTYLNEKDTGKINAEEYIQIKKYSSAVLNSIDRVIQKFKTEYVMWKKAFEL